MSDDAVRSSIDGVWRIESARLIAGLVRMVKDVGLAEDLAQDALVAALEPMMRDPAAAVAMGERARGRVRRDSGGDEGSVPPWEP